MAETHGIWSGTLSFGLVTLPVALVPAAQSRKAGFHLLHREDNGRLRRRMFCPKHNTYVHPEHIVRGFEVEADKFVVLQDSEIAAIEPKRSQTIEIQSFVDLSAIDPLYFLRPYYLLPRGADKPYRLLVQTLKAAGKAGIAQFIMHARQYLAAIYSVEGALCLATCYYQQEVLEPDELAAQHKPNAASVKAIRHAIDKLAEDFDPRKLRDVYQERVDELIRAKKRRHETVEIAPAKAEGEEEAAAEAEGVDLIEALEASLAKAKGRRRAA